jgi:membrane-associated phospholipid phosphatase
MPRSVDGVIVASVSGRAAGLLYRKKIVKRLTMWVLAVAFTSGVAQSSARAQTEPKPPPPGETPVSAAPASASAPTPIEGGGAKGLLRDIGSDYKNFFSIDTALWLGIGGGAAYGVHFADDTISDSDDVNTFTADMKGGEQYGAAYLQFPLAIAWWTVGHLAGSLRDAEAGRDLLRAQISALSWTYAFKYSFNRTRPNGDPRSFPSGHASATFATATVLQQHYGWKIGLPLFAAAGYTAASRVNIDKHWTSDVVFGAVLGVVNGRTVTVHLRGAKVSLAPWAVPGGGGVLVSTLR